jgi:hypothetical protein
MKQNVTLTITFLILLLLLTLHIAGDIALGYDKGGPWVMLGFLVFGIWIFGVIALGDRPIGHVINLVFSLLSLYVPYLHTIGHGLAGAVLRSPQYAYFFIWVTLAGGVTALISAILSVQALWRSSGRQY